ncbi:MAG TPA: biopolymer transporter ExbD [Lacipirellula sp.]
MPLKTQHDEMPQLNLTPMIDVVFLLIVFFMCAAKFSDLEERDIDLRLPEVAKADAANTAPQARQVAVYGGGRISFDTEDVTLMQLTERLTSALAEQPGLSVVILGDAGCEFQHVAETLAACKEAGVTKLAVSVRVAQGQASGRR